MCMHPVTPHIFSLISTLPDDEVRKIREGAGRFNLTKAVQ